MSFVPINPRPMLQDLYVYSRPTDFCSRQLLSTRTPRSIATDADRKQLANFLRSVDKDVVIRLKWGDTEYKGKLVSIDSYMNIQLSGAEEYIDQKMTGALGQVLIRCNNVLWIRGAKEGERDVKMED